MSHAAQAVILEYRKPLRGKPGRARKCEGDRFTPLCRRDARLIAAKKRQRSKESFSAICFPGWTRS
jgi:hypothetical protein